MSQVSSSFPSYYDEWDDITNATVVRVYTATYGTKLDLGDLSLVTVVRVHTVTYGTKFDHGVLAVGYCCSCSHSYVRNEA